MNLVSLINAERPVFRGDLPLPLKKGNRKVILFNKCVFDHLVFIKCCARQKSQT